MGESPRMSTAICHLILAGSSVWTGRLLYNAGHIQWAYGTLGLYFAKSCVGVVRYGTKKGHKLIPLYSVIELWSIAVGIPFITTDLCSLLGYNGELALSHAAIGLLPVFGSFAGRRAKTSYYLNIVVIAALISLTIVGLMSSNYWSIAAAFSYAVNLFGIRYQGTINRVPSIDLYTIGVCFLNYFAYRALTDTSIIFR